MSSVDMDRFINPHKVVVERMHFFALANAQNESFSEMRIESFGYGRLKHSFSQIKRYLDLLEISKLTPFPKKRTKGKVVVVMMKKKDIENEKVEKNLWMVKYYI
jgi:hypothetical protein